MANPHQKQKNTSPDGNECTQLLQLLARNPSALKVLKFTSPSNEQFQDYKARRTTKCLPAVRYELKHHFVRPEARGSKASIYCLPPKLSGSRSVPENVRKLKLTTQCRNEIKVNNTISLTKEEVELKSRCVDDLGNFNFDAILPAVYWKIGNDYEEKMTSI